MKKKLKLIGIKNLIDEYKLSTLLLMFGSMLITILLIYTFFATPIADVWKYHNDYINARSHGWIKSLPEYINTSLGHTGRIFQWMIMFFSFTFFGMRAVKIVPFIMIILLVGVVYWLIYQLKIFQKDKKIISLSVSMILSASFLMLLPSFYDSILWLDASVSYLGGVIFLFLNLNFLYLVLTKNLSKIVKSFIFITVILSQTLIETASALFIGWLIVGLIICFIYKNKDKAKIFAQFIFAAIIGFSIVYFSPGSIARRAGFSPKFNFKWIFIESFNSFKSFATEWKLWILILPIILLTAIIFSVHKNIKLTSKQLAIFALSIFATSTYPVFVLNNITQEYVPLRIMSIPVMGLSISFFVLGLALGKCKIIRSYKNIITYLLFGFICATIPLILFNSVRKIQVLAIREKIVKTRDASLNRQIEQGVEKYKIMKAPIMVPGQATDFDYGYGQWDKNGRNWIINSYLDFKGLSSDLPSNRVEIIDPVEIYY